AEPLVHVASPEAEIEAFSAPTFEQIDLAKHAVEVPAHSAKIFPSIESLNAEPEAEALASAADERLCLEDEAAVSIAEPTSLAPAPMEELFELEGATAADPQA